MPRRSTISLSDELYNYFKEKAAIRGISMSSMISTALHEYVKQETMIEQMKSDQWKQALKKYSSDDE